LSLIGALFIVAFSCGAADEGRPGQPVSCGSAAAAVVLGYFGIDFDDGEVRELGGTAGTTSVAAMVDFLALKGLAASAVRLTPEEFGARKLPAILYLRGEGHPVVTRKPGTSWSQSEAPMAHNI